VAGAWVVALEVEAATEAAVGLTTAQQLVPFNVSFVDRYLAGEAKSALRLPAA
jgi:hypothetical protein